MIDVRRLRVLRELADHGTVAAAAAALHLTPSAVSQQLSTLTKEAGVPLVEPHGRRLRLTDAAHVLLDHAHRIFAQLEEAEADLARHAAGERRVVRVGGFATALSHVVAPAAVSLGQGEQPITLQAVEVSAPDAFADLAAGDLDVVVALESEGAPQQDNPRFHRRDLMADVLDAALPEKHRLSGGSELRLEDLAAEQWVVPPPGTTCHDIVRVSCAAAGFAPRVAHLTGDWVATGALVAAGAVSLVPRMARNEVPADVVIRPLRGTSAARHVFAATRRGSETEPATARVLDALATRAAELADGS